MCVYEKETLELRKYFGIRLNFENNLNKSDSSLKSCGVFFPQKHVIETLTFGTQLNELGIKR